MKKSKLILSVIAIVFLVSFIFLFHSTNKTHAQSAASCTPSAPCVVSGTAVFTNTATDLTIPAPGYQIYFSDYSGYGGTTGNMTYSASYDSTNGINGYAWSPEYGWIQFNDWTATVLSFENDAETPDWATGAISLNGSNGGTTGNILYNVAYDPASGVNTGRWAWGGNVLGWIDFSGTSITPNASSTCAITPASSTITPPTPPTSVTLTFSGSNVTNCTVSGGSFGITGVSESIPGSSTVTPSTTTTYNMSCLGSDGITNISCSPAIVTVNSSDLCPNISGVQTTVPTGMTIDAYGNCVVPSDLCPNISGVQTSVPSGDVIDPTDGYCVSVSSCPVPPIDDICCPSGDILDTTTAPPTCVLSCPPTDVCVSATKHPHYIEN